MGEPAARIPSFDELYARIEQLDTRLTGEILPITLASRWLPAAR